MKEKRYFCDWCDDDANKKSRTIIALAIIAISFCIVLVCMLVYGDFSVFDYPEETFQKMEKAYIPYVHKGDGIDIIGLKRAVHGLKDPIISNENIELTYGYTDCAVTVTLDKNYNTLSVVRSAQTEQEYLREVIITNLELFTMCVILLAATMFLTMLVAYLFSIAHKFIDKILAKNKS